MGRKRDRKKLRLRSMSPTLRGSLRSRLRVRGKQDAPAPKYPNCLLLAEADNL
jgi:hypothetical protein